MMFAAKEAATNGNRSSDEAEATLPETKFGVDLRPPALSFAAAAYMWRPSFSRTSGKGVAHSENSMDTVDGDDLATQARSILERYLEHTQYKSHKSYTESTAEDVIQIGLDYVQHLDYTTHSSIFQCCENGDQTKLSARESSVPSVSSHVISATSWTSVFELSSSTTAAFSPSSEIWQVLLQVAIAHSVKAACLMKDSTVDNHVECKNQLLIAAGLYLKLSTESQVVGHNCQGDQTSETSTSTSTAVAATAGLLERRHPDILHACHLVCLAQAQQLAIAVNFPLTLAEFGSQLDAVRLKLLARLAGELHHHVFSHLFCPDPPFHVLS